MATILTKKSDTASAVPLAADLTNAAGGAELAVNATDKRLFSKTSGGTVVELGTNPSTLVLPSGSANGVAYLNGSKVVTSGSALTFDGSFANLTLTSGTSANGFLQFSNSADGGTQGYIGDSKALISGGANSSLAVRGESNILFGIASAEQMRLTSTGLGIGTSSPTQLLNVRKDQAAYTWSRTENQSSSASAYAGLMLGAFGNSWGLAIGSSAANSNALTFILDAGGSNAEKMRLDSSGNLGLGVTPSAWGTAKALQIGGSGFALSSNGAGSGDGSVTWNGYYNGTNWIYSYTGGVATRYRQNESGHAWFTAPSGTAGNAITFTQAATLDANGNFLVGTTSASNSGIGSGFQVQNLSGNGTTINIGHPSSASDGYSYALFSYNNGIIGSIGQSGTTAVAYNTSSDYRLKNITGPVTTSGAYIDNLNPVEGTWKADGSIFVGLIAHEVQEASRTKVATGTKDGAEMQAMDYSNSELIANLIAEVKSLRQRVATLEAK